MAQSQCIPVIVVDPSGKELKFKSVVEAATTLGISTSSFREALKRERTVKGYKPRIDEETIKEIKANAKPVKKQNLSDQGVHGPATRYEMAIMKRNLPNGFLNNKEEYEKFLKTYEEYEKMSESFRRKEEPEEEEDDFELEEPEPVLGLFSAKNRKLKQDPIYKVDSKNNLLKEYQTVQALEEDGYKHTKVFYALNENSLTNLYMEVYWIYKSTYEAYWRAITKQRELALRRTPKMKDLKKKEMNGVVRFII